ncbi:MAG: formate--tetrahydrofolate ligase, partial [Verrucomicrobiae bacterium]|nr:formate--tetrahydrofolate ligase [Verrucomicrobiae bacterium]NNJ86307.1 formate--tetrahydrofolate ligase [Akkermansiaceae bacterium]
VRNLHENFGLPCVVAINKFSADTDAEIALLKNKLAHMQVEVVLAEHWEKGGEGAEEMARAVLDVIEKCPANFKFTYEDDTPLWKKMEAVATRIYGASEVVADTKVRNEIKRLQDAGYGSYPICVAKTQYSFSTDAKLLGAPENHVVKVREVRLAAGAEFVIIVCGDIMTMPGLPKVPAANQIDLGDDGQIVGLF